MFCSLVFRDFTKDDCSGDNSLHRFLLCHVFFWISEVLLLEPRWWMIYKRIGRINKVCYFNALNAGYKQHLLFQRAVCIDIEVTPDLQVCFVYMFTDYLSFYGHVSRHECHSRWTLGTTTALATQGTQGTQLAADNVHPARHVGVLFSVIFFCVWAFSKMFPWKFLLSLWDVDNGSVFFNCSRTISVFRGRMSKKEVVGGCNSFLWVITQLCEFSLVFLGKVRPHNQNKAKSFLLRSPLISREHPCLNNGIFFAGSPTYVYQRLSMDLSVSPAIWQKQDSGGGCVPPP